MPTAIRSRTATGIVALVFLTGLVPGRATGSVILRFGSDTGLLSGTLPATPGTYVQALFQNSSDDGSIAANTVRLTLTVPTSESGLYIDEVGFNFNTNVAPGFAHESGVQTSSGPAFNASGIAVNGTGNEKFNTNFPLPNAAAARLESPKSSVYNLTGLQYGSDLSQLLTPNSNGYLGAVHIAGFANGSAGVAGQVVVQTVPIPEPSLLAMAALVLTPLGVSRFMRSRRSSEKSGRG